MTEQTTDLAAMARDFGVSRESWVQLETYVKLLEQWQARVNLIAPSTADNIWERHIKDSLQLIPLLPVGCKVIADLGTGAGLPGMVLGIARPVRVHLYEANGKKVAFLREAVRRTQIDAQVHQVRLESLVASRPPPVDVVTARALAPLGELLGLAQPFLEAGATGLFMKGKDVENERAHAAKRWRFGYNKHPSLTDSQSVILEIKEVSRVAT
jgi:16S rRNA (guanine527-N7)-methyltransferase